jgi:hypothetical protein
MSKSRKSRTGLLTWRLSPEAAQWVRQGLVRGGIALFLLAAVVVALHNAKRHVDRGVAFHPRPPAIVLKDRPVWMSDYLARQIVQVAQPVGAHSSFDHQLLVDVAAALKGNPWIKKVRAVRRAYSHSPGDTIEVDCEYRVPLALVHWQDYYWLVDSDGVKLPEQFNAQQLPHVVNGRGGKLQFRVIQGVTEPPVESGRRWPGDDLAAGLELAKYLYGQPFTEEVTRVDVSNFAGRRDAKEAQIVLLTRRGSEIRWGRPINARDFFVEVSVAQKLNYLRRVWEQFGRVDAGQAWIDIRFDKITYPSGGTPSAIGQARLDGQR